MFSILNKEEGRWYMVYCIYCMANEACSGSTGPSSDGLGLKIDGPVPEYSITLGPGPE